MIFIFKRSNSCAKKLHRVLVQGRTKPIVMNNHHHTSGGAVLGIGSLGNSEDAGKPNSSEASNKRERLKCPSLVSKIQEGCEAEAVKGHAGATQSRNMVNFISISCRSKEDDILEYHSTSTSSFEFNNGERTGQRTALGPYHKPPPSKWDDAEKWLAGLPTQAFISRGSGDSFDCYHIDDNIKILNMHSERSEEVYSDPILRSEKPSSDSTFSEKVPSNGFNIYDLPLCPYETTSYASSLATVRSVSMRDMGTEMTPLASQGPSGTGTPVRAGTPTMSRPVTSHLSTLQDIAPSLLAMQESGVIESDSGSTKLHQLAEKEIHTKNRQEILALCSQLGNANMASWASKEEEDEDAFKSLKSIEVKKKVLETRAAAWKEAEKAKCMARYMQEDAKIQAWENHEKAKAEAEMRRIEVKMEKMRVIAHRKLTRKLATLHRMAEERRAAAEAKCNEKTAKAVQNAECIRNTGRLPSFFHCHY